MIKLIDCVFVGGRYVVKYEVDKNFKENFKKAQGIKRWSSPRAEKVIVSAFRELGIEKPFSVKLI